MSDIKYIGMDVHQEAIVNVRMRSKTTVQDAEPS
jgi:hypothetical protein